MRVYETPSGKKICDMRLDELEDGQMAFKDMDAIFNVIRENCGDEFADDFRKLLDDYEYFNSEYIYDATMRTEDAELDKELERLEELERNMYSIRKLAKLLQQKISLMNFNKSSAFKDIVYDIDTIVTLSNR